MWSKLYHRVKNLPMLIACHVEYILMMLHMPEVALCYIICLYRAPDVVADCP